MRMMKRNRGLWMVGAAALAVLTLVSTGSAQERRAVSTEISGSVVVFPKVIWDGTRDTIIELSNTGNPMVHARCFYINAAPVNPSLPPSATNPPRWAEVDFDVWLTKQQPTHWVASAGRQTNIFDTFGSDGSGLDPGLVPPVPLGFVGELKCVQIDDSGAPMPGNKLKGEAILRRADGDVSKYNAIALAGNPTLSGIDIGNDLELNLTDLNPGGEYSACPDTLIFNHFAYGAEDLVISQLGTCAGGNCPVNTTLTLVPCQENLENQIPGRVSVSFLIFDEFESRLSASTTVDCWLNLPLNQIAPAGPGNPFTPGALGGSTTRHTRIRPVTQGEVSQGGVIGIAEETRLDSNTASGAGATAAYNLQIQGNRFDGATQRENDEPAPGTTDHIVLPAE